MSKKESGVMPIHDDLPLVLLGQLYRTMIRVRLVEERVADLVEDGEIKCPCHLCIGQEAIAAGVCAALRDEDYVWGGHRSHGHYLAKGGDLKSMMAELYGKAAGCSGGRGGSMHLIAPEVGILGTVPLVAATIPLAVGAGLSAKTKGDGAVSVSFFGDGATEEGHFHESLNLAALYKLPVIFVCENNFYSSHLQLLERRAEDNIVKSAEAHGLPGVRLDGNDVGTVYRGAVAAVSRARDNGGPTLLECDTYRWRGHVGPEWDLDVGVKRRDELKEWLSRDPVTRAADSLTGRGVSAEELEAFTVETRQEIDEAVCFARAAPYPAPEELLEHVFLSPEDLDG